MKEIIHIVGLNSEYKIDFISKVLSINPNYNIIDIDEISNKINSEIKISKLYDDYEKIKFDKNKSKIIANNINIEWSRELQVRLNKLLNSTDKDSIILGLTTSIITNGTVKILINLETNYKFIIEIDLKENAKQIIRNNLKEYKHDIINGRFPLEYLNLDFLIKRRENLNQIYIKNLYIQKKIDEVLKFLKDHVPNLNNIKAKKLYFASNIEFKKTITEKNIILFNNDILGILNVFRLTKFAYDNEHKVLKELEKDGFKELDKDCYIYEITELDDVFFDGENYKCTKKLKINKSTYIQCIKDIFIQYGIKFIKFK